ncbi:ribbon-helix-helix domain-containing protein [Methylobacterium iners]|uniref:Ribbon-helix-helix protein CopG domain-containing protein n=1 Tax=Methylobacterium iners TaxID=418707 RepID=A0ABQ4RX07_9HYPH|nr:type II toxin-antitoxin system ParD family antitoxin [Methylobacterium iners]GJD94035.1 hypothetical protein OCOJLMKI_1235 [Methylobacterium iners]
MERLTIAIPEPMAAELRAAVEAGEFASTSEAVQEAVSLWFVRRHSRDSDVEWLAEAWDVGKASGRYGPIDFEALRRESRDRLKSTISRSGDAG